MPRGCRYLHAMVHIAANGLGVTLLPAMSINTNVLGDAHLQIKNFSNDNVSREVGMAWRKSDPRREGYLLLAEFVKDHFGYSARSEKKIK